VVVEDEGTYSGATKQPEAPSDRPGLGPGLVSPSRHESSEWVVRPFWDSDGPNARRPARTGTVLKRTRLMPSVECSTGGGLVPSPMAGER
jgi:hypothetical protein